MPDVFLHRRISGFSRVAFRFASLMIVIATAALAQSDNCVIGSSIVGPVRIGMTVMQARQALRSTTIAPAEDSDRIAILVVTRDGKRIMDLYPDNDNPAKEQAVIELIRVYDPACSTADGVHAGMLLSEVQQRYGRVTRLVAPESEPREYAEFERLPNWIEVQPGQGDTGIYPKGKRCATQFKPTARVTSLWVSKPLTNKLPEDEGFCNSPATNQK
jgi:hypothetical protein